MLKLDRLSNIKKTGKNESISTDDDFISVDENNISISENAISVGDGTTSISESKRDKEDKKDKYDKKNLGIPPNDYFTYLLIHNDYITLYDLDIFRFNLFF